MASRSDDGGSPRYAEGIALGIGAGALWGGVFLAVQILSAFTPIEITVGRYIIYGLLSAILFFPVWRGVVAKLSRDDLFALFWLSLVGHIAFHLFLVVGVHMVGIAPTALIIGLLPITISLAGSREVDAVELRKLAVPLLMIAAGIVCINLDVLTGQHLGGDFFGRLIGLACAFGALVTWTIYGVANTNYLKGRPQISSSEWTMLTGMMSGALALFVLPLCFLTGAMQSNRDWAFFAMVGFAIGIGASVVGNGLWNAASRRLPLTLSGQLIVFETLFGLLYGFVYYGRWPRPLEWAAILLLPSGVLWSARVHVKAGGASSG